MTEQQRQLLEGMTSMYKLRQIAKDIVAQEYKEECDDVLSSRGGEGGYVVKDIDELRELWEERKET